MVKLAFLLTFFIAANLLVGFVNKVRPNDWRGWFYDLHAYGTGMILAFLPPSIFSVVFVVIFWMISVVLTIYILKLDESVLQGPLKKFYSFPTYLLGYIAGAIVMPR